MSDAPISAPGIYDMPMSRYLGDPVATPSLSAGCAHTLLTRSPRHAWHAHPRLNPAWQPSPSTDEQEEGTALHAAILERRDIVHVADWQDWRKHEAQAERREARQAGKVPILVRRWERIVGAALAVREQLRQHEVGDIIAQPGRAEAVMIWQEETPAGMVWCRARLDWLPAGSRPYIYDLKTVARSAEPGAWGRNMVSSGYALGAAWYLRGARALGLQPRGYRFIVLEREPPHGVSVCECSPAMLDLANRQVDAALDTWAHCLRDGTWPMYPPFVASIEPPAWEEYRMAEREMREEQMRERTPYLGRSERVITSATPFA